jgi:alkanesulfonate monooxygenase SsuD/methylene tetrahydromethanopterin reductase-like flavin-dependent oxidoreductase (luciferase family)
MAIDGLSDGRMILGLGAGWMQEEHDMFGYPLGSVKERLDRFEEGLEVISQLIRSDEPVNFQGQYYQLLDAVLLPRAQTSIMVGGDGPKRTMPLVAKYADIWNCQGTLENFKQKNTLLDKLLHGAGRPLNAVKRTYAAFMACWQTDAELDKLMNDIPEKVQSFFGGKEGYVKSMQDSFSTSPNDVVEHIKAFEDGGCEEFVIHYFGMNGDTQLDILAEHVLPRFH